MICEVCKEEFEGFKGLSVHITKAHKISKESYYDQYLSKEEHPCPYCSQKRKFNDLKAGYYYTCGQPSCSNKAASQHGKKTVSKRDGVSHWMQKGSVKDKFNKTTRERYGYDWYFSDPKMAEYRLLGDLKLHTPFINEFLNKENLTLKDCTLLYFKRKGKCYLDWVKGWEPFLRKRLDPNSKFLIFIADEWGLNDFKKVCEMPEFHLSFCLQEPCPSDTPLKDKMIVIYKRETMFSFIMSLND